MKLQPLILLIAFCAVGCKSDEAQFVGTWNGPFSYPMELKADGTFKSDKVLGKWWYKKYRLHLETTSIQGVDVKDVRKSVEEVVKNEPERTKEMEAFTDMFLTPKDCRVSDDKTAFFVLTSTGESRTCNKSQP